MPGFGSAPRTAPGAPVGLTEGVRVTTFPAGSGNAAPENALSFQKLFSFSVWRFPPSQSQGNDNSIHLNGEENFLSIMNGGNSTIGNKHTPPPKKQANKNNNNNNKNRLQPYPIYLEWKKCV